MEGTSRHSGVPRILDVQQYASARGPEIAALHAVSWDSDKPGSGSSIPRHLRRRATSHNRRRSYYWNSKKRSAAVIQDSSAQPKSNSQTGSETAEPGSYAGALPQEEPQKKRPCRRVRRKFELKGGADGSGGCSSDGTRRLVTHVWHAKRFSMTKIWGYWLPEGLPGRGRGSRAVMRWARDAALLQDASFYSPVELSGPSEALLDVLQLVLEPPPPAVNAMSDNAKAEYEGLQYGKFMLHHMDRSPYAAIAPVTLLWRPVPKELQSEQSVGLIPAEKRQVWVWVHAAAFDEALMCLQTACQRQASIESIVLQCKSRKGEFGRLDLLGHGALAVLKKVLHPISRSVTLGYLFNEQVQHLMDRQLQAREFHLQRLRRFTMDQTGNSVLSNAVTLDSLVPITRDLKDEELKQCVINAIRNALNRSWMRAPQPEELVEVDIRVTMDDFLLAFRDLNLLPATNSSKMYTAQENSAEDTCAINTSSSSSSLGLHSKLLAAAAWLPGAGVLGMEVWDPRDPPHNQAKFEALPLLGSDQGTGPSSEQMGHGRAESENILADQAEQKHGCGEEYNCESFPSWLHGHLSDSPKLWTYQSGINGQSIVDCPISEKDLSTRRHKERMVFFQLSETGNGPLRVEGKMHGSPKCPILLLKHEHKMLSACGWSLILPIAWVRAFWVPLVYAGGHVIGLREQHWLSTDAGLPSFPYDFPDCFAYSQFMARQAAELQEQCSKRPLPNKRGPSSPSPAFWRFSVGPGSGISSQETEELAVNMGDHLTEDLLANGGKTRNEPVAATGSNALEFVMEKTVDRQIATVKVNHEGDATDVMEMCTETVENCGESTSPCINTLHGPQQVTVDDAGPMDTGSIAAGASVVDTDSGPGDTIGHRALDQTDNSISLPCASRNSTGFESRLSAAENIEGPLMFVARTITTLMNTLRDNNLHHLPILPDETRPGNFNILETGRVAWHQAMHDGAQESTKGCLVRVLIRAPRKGNFDAGAIIYMPIPADEESYLCSSPRWQGFNDSGLHSASQQAWGKRKIAAKQASTHTLQESDGLNVCAGPLETGTKLSQVEQGKVHRQPCNVRSPIGIVTSSVPRGSASTSSVAICEVGGLGMLRARQFLDEKWKGQSEIFLLARNTTSSMYRPALASIVLEKQTDVL